MHENQPASTQGSTTSTTDQQPKQAGLTLIDGPGSLRKVDFTCPTHGIQSADVVCFLDGSWAEPKCRLCAEDAEKQRLAARQQATERAALEQRHSIVRRLHDRSGVPLRFATKSFDDFRADTPEQKRALNACMAYAKNFADDESRGRCLLLCGKPGTGKTHLACAVVADVIDRHAMSACYLAFSKAIRSVKQTYSKASEITEQGALDALCRPDLLVLDEVGVQFGSDTEKMIGFEIINARYEQMKPTVLVSNFDTSDLTDCLGERVMDRLRENRGKVLSFEGSSHRMQSRQRGQE